MIDEDLRLSVELYRTFTDGYVVALYPVYNRGIVSPDLFEMTVGDIHAEKSAKIRYEEATPEKLVDLIQFLIKLIEIEKELK